MDFSSADWSRAMLDKNVQTMEMIWWWRKLFFFFSPGDFPRNANGNGRQNSQEYYCQRQNRQQFSMIFTIINHRTGHQKVQKFAMKPLTRIRLVVLLEFWTFDVIFKVDKRRDVKSTDHGKLLSMSIFSPTSGRHSPPPAPLDDNDQGRMEDFVIEGA